MKTVKQKQKRTIVGLVISMICLLMFTVTMTFAYFTARNSAESTAMQFGTLAVGINGYNAVSADSHTLVPGCTINLAGNIELAERENDVIVNDSTIGAFVRIKLTIEPATSGDTLPDTTGLLSTIQTAFGSNWLTSGSDGYLYYAGKFMPVGTTTLGTNEVTVFNLSSVSFKFNENTFGNDWQGKSFKLKIEAEAIQADHVGVTDSQITTGGQTLVDAIANAKANNETDSAWNGVSSGASGNEQGQDEQNNPLAEASLQYLDFTPVNADGSAISGATTLSESANEMPTLNGGKATASNLMANGTKFVSVKSKADTNKATGDIAIPAYIKVENRSVAIATKDEWQANNAYKVIKIDSYAFQRCSELTSITIPNSVTNIGDLVFDRCASLVNIKIPSSATEIGIGILANCSGLTSIVVESGNPNYDSRNNCNAVIETSTNCLISGCKNTVIPNDIVTLGDYSFYGCTGLTGVTIPEGVTSIGYYALSKCTGLTSVTIPSTVESIVANAFRESTGISEIVIPRATTSIGNYAFSDCNLNRIIVESGNPYYDSRDNCNVLIKTSSNQIIQGSNNATIPSTVTSIYSYAFSNCVGLTNITIPSNITTIPDGAFESCSSLASVTISEGVQTIKGYAFNNCSSLQSITIPSSVRRIEAYVLEGCSSLQSIIVDNNNTYYNSRENSNAIIETASNVLVAGCVNTVIPQGVTEILRGAFDGCSGLTSINIPEGVNTIEYGAFWDCGNLESITLPNSLSSIGSSGFVGGGSFFDCNRLQNVYYHGTSSEWNSIGISSSEGSDALSVATIYCLSFDGTNVTITDKNGNTISSGFNVGSVSTDGSVKTVVVTFTNNNNYQVTLHFLDNNG